MDLHLDKKDYEILGVLDENFRTSFSEIAKKVNLSKNSVALRFQKLKNLMLHNTAGINNQLLGYTFVKIFYVFDFFDEKTENEIANAVKKHKNMLYAARLYGTYNLELAFFIEKFEDLINPIEEFNKQFSKKISQKDIQIITKDFHFRNNFLHEKSINKSYNVVPVKEKYVLTISEKKILILLRQDPRMSIIDLSEKSGLNPKTVVNNIKNLEKQGIIMGYFMVLDTSKFNSSTFKLLIQVTRPLDFDKFEEYLCSIKNIKHFSKMLGSWDYELDMVYPSIIELQKEIEVLKHKFPSQLKKIDIISFGKRIATNKEKFLI